MGLYIHKFSSMNKEKNLEISAIRGIIIVGVGPICRPLLIGVGVLCLFLFPGSHFLLHSDDKLRYLSSKRQ